VEQSIVIIIYTTAALLGLACVFNILANPKFGLYLVVFFLPFTFWRFPFNIKISEGIALITLLSFLSRYLIGKQLKIYRTPLFLPILLVIAVAILSFVQIRLIPPNIYNESWAHGRYSPNLSGILSVLRYGFLLIFLILIVNLINNERILEKTLKIYLISGVIVSLIGIFQLVAYITGVELLRYLTDFFSTGWQGTTLVPQHLGEITLPRIMGPNNEPKMFSNTLVAIIPFTFMALMHNWTILRRKTLWFILLLQVPALFLTFSASGWVAIMISLLFLSLYLSKISKKNLLRYIILLSLPLFSMLFILQKVKVPILSGLYFNLYRIIHYLSPTNVGQVGPMIAGLEMFKENPILGVGIGNFSFHYPNYNVLNLPQVDYAALASNEYISILAETGLLGAISWLPFIFTIFKFIKESKLKSFKQSKHFLYSVFITSLAATIGCWSQLWATYGIFNPHIWFPLALAVAARRQMYLKRGVDGIQKNKN